MHADADSKKQRVDSGRPLGADEYAHHALPWTTRAAGASAWRGLMPVDFEILEPYADGFKYIAKRRRGLSRHDRSRIARSHCSTRFALSVSNRIRHAERCARAPSRSSFPF